MKNNKKQGRSPFSPLTLLAALLLIGGVRELLGSGTIFGISVFGEAFAAMGRGGERGSGRI